MKFINSLIIVLIITVYSLAFTIHPFGKEVLARRKLPRLNRKRNSLIQMMIFMSCHTSFRLRPDTVSVT